MSGCERRLVVVLLLSALSMTVLCACPAGQSADDDETASNDDDSSEGTPGDDDDSSVLVLPAALGAIAHCSTCKYDEPYPGLVDWDEVSVSIWTIEEAPPSAVSSVSIQASSADHDPSSPYVRETPPEALGAFESPAPEMYGRRWYGGASPEDEPIWNALCNQEPGIALEFVATLSDGSELRSTEYEFPFSWEGGCR